MKLSEIEDRCSAATTGPWFKQAVGLMHRIESAETMLSALSIAVTETDAQDAEFIAAARTDTPALVALVRQLGEALEKLSKVLRDANIRVNGSEAALVAYRSVLDD